MADNVLFYDPLLVNTETNKVSLEKENIIVAHLPENRNTSQTTPRVLGDIIPPLQSREQKNGSRNFSPLSRRAAPGMGSSVGHIMVTKKEPRDSFSSLHRRLVKLYYLTKQFLK